MLIHFQSLDAKSPDISKIKRLYHSAFPKNERAPFRRLVREVDGKSAQLLGIYNDTTWLGFFYIVNYNDLSYIFYFAIDDNQRNQGFGGIAIQTLIEQFTGRRLFLAAEQLDPHADNYAMRVRRHNFYTRNGLSDMHMKIQEAGVIYDVLGAGGAVTPEEYQTLMLSHLGMRWCKRVAVKMFHAVP